MIAIRKPETMLSDGDMMTFGEHLDVLRKLLLKVAAVTIVFAGIIFCCKNLTFSILLAPSEYDFCTYRYIEDICRIFDQGFRFEEYHVDLIATDLSSQFMTHVSTSLYLGFLCASPFILFEIFGFVSPALLEKERKYSMPIVVIMYLLFLSGVLMSYYVLFPISFRFLGTYSVAEKVHSAITLDSYVSTFVTLTLLMGLVFQLPVVAFILGKLGLLKADIMVRSRRYAILIICIAAAIITPPDIMTMILVAVPLYLLYEISIVILKKG
jgi:twin arginine-targeting protein translocase tatC